MADPTPEQIDFFKKQLSQHTTPVTRHLAMFANMAKLYPNTAGGLVENYLLKHGQHFPHAPLPDTIPRGPARECFKNAVDLCWLHGYRYCEGYAAHMLPTWHGWCLNVDGTVIDPTWPEPEPGSPPREYFGIEIDMKIAGRIMARRKVYGVLHSDEFFSKRLNPKLLPV